MSPPTKKNNASAKGSAPHKVSPTSSPQRAGAGNTKKKFGSGRLIPKNTKYANQIDIHKTRVPEVAISIAHKPKEDGGGTFTYFIKKKFEDETTGDELADLWGITSIMPRRYQGDGEGNAGIMPQCRGSKYDWLSFLHVFETTESLEKAGKKLANGLTKFTRDKNLSGMANADTYLFRSVRDDNKPLCYFLLDEDVKSLTYLIHGEKTLEEVMNDDDILEQFWGSTGNAKEVMGHLDEDDWSDLA